MISIIIPSYKEYENLITLIPEIRNTLNGDLHEIIVVDDNSCDGTEKIENARIVTRTSERGLASAVIRGIEECETDGFIVMDADHQHPPSVLPSIVISLDHNELVVGSRYVKGGGTQGWTLWRRFVSKVASSLGKPLSGINDSSSGLFGAYKSLLNTKELNPIGFKLGLDIYNKLKLRSKTEVPYVFLSRHFGDSKFTSKQVKEYLKQLAQLYYNEYFRQFVKFGIVGSLGTVINIGVLTMLTELAGVHYILSALVAIFVAMTSNFFWNKHWTFKV